MGVFSRTSTDESCDLHYRPNLFSIERVLSWLRHRQFSRAPENGATLSLAASATAKVVVVDCCVYRALLVKSLLVLMNHAAAALACVRGLLAMRTKLRTLYGISGSICNDAMASYCCMPCMVCQMDQEMTELGL